MDETGAYYTERNKSERKPLIQWFRKMVMMTHMRDSRRDTDVKNKLLDSVGEGKGGMI